MKKLVGIVKNLQKREERLGSTFYYLAMCYIGKVRVRIKLHEPISINENDKISLAGSVKNGMLNVVAYHNFTTKKSDNNRTYMSLFLGIINMIVGGIVFKYEYIFGGVLVKVFASTLLLVGFYLVVSGLITYFTIQNLSKE